VSTPGGSAPHSYRIDNTVSAHCRNGGVNCAVTMGREAALEPVRNIATAGAIATMAGEKLDEKTRLAIEQALVECADIARGTILITHKHHYAGLSPTAQECNQLVKDKTGRSVKLSIKLGSEMHEEALNCAEERLNKEIPGRFSREPRYHHDRQTGRKRVIPPDEVKALKDSGNVGELKGTLAPDIVIHLGNPVQVQAIYDFKFPCANIDKPGRWNDYPEGHPFEELNQGQVYEQVLGVPAARIQPRMGVIR
jgi:hypothetical protein